MNNNVNTNDINQDMPNSWDKLLALGILTLVLGVIGVGMSFALTLTSIVFFGAFLLVSGSVQLAHALFGKEVRNWNGKAMHALIAVLYIVGGLMTVFNPIAASFALTAMLAGVFLAMGGYRVYMAVEVRKQGKPWGTLATIGVADIAMASIIMLGMPWTAFWVIGLLIAIELIMNVTMLILTSLTRRNLDQHQSQPA